MTQTCILFRLHHRAFRSTCSFDASTRVLVRLSLQPCLVHGISASSIITVSIPTRVLRLATSPLLLATHPARSSLLGVQPRRTAVV